MTHPLRSFLLHGSSLILLGLTASSAGHEDEHSSTAEARAGPQLPYVQSVVFRHGSRSSQRTSAQRAPAASAWEL